MKNIVILLAAVSCLNFTSCTTLMVTDRITGNYETRNWEIGKPNPYFYAVLPFSLVFDLATSPIQMLWLGAQL